MNSVTYPEQLNADKAKLFACYSLVQQALDEHNSKLELAKQLGVYPAYWAEFKKHLKPLLAERNRLRENIRVEWCQQNNVNWKELNEDELDAAYLEMYGNKEQEKVKPTNATSSLLDNLKAIDLSKLEKSAIVDPYEDFTGFTKVDPNNEISETATKITFDTFHTGMNDSYYYSDKGANHFDGDFDHLIEHYISACSSDVSAIGVWTLSNNIDDIYGLEQASQSALHFLSVTSSSLNRWRLREQYNGVNNDDSWDGASKDTLYFTEIERDEAVGTYGHLYAYIRTGSHTGTLQDTLDVTLSAKLDFRYYFGIINNDYFDDTVYQTGYTQNHDLQEGGGVTEKTGSDSGAGADSKASGNPLATLVKSETGSGSDAIISSLLEATETGSGVEVATLMAVLISDDAGIGSEFSTLPGLEAVFGGDGGSGLDALKAIIETTGLGSGMRLHGRQGKVRMPSKGVNL
jgi:hypothetical protein